MIYNGDYDEYNPTKLIWEDAVNGDWKAVKRRIDSDASLVGVRGDAIINEEKKPLLTLLHLVAKDDSDVEVLEYLISQGADVNARDDYGSTPLHMAAQYNPNVEVLKYLISQGADVNVGDVDGWTPLHVAAKSNSKEVVEYLVSQGADVNAEVIGDSRRPLDFAKTSEKRRILREAMEESETI